MTHYIVQFKCDPGARYSR